MSAAPWLTVIGIGADGLDGLSPIARAALDAAEIVFGGRRHLAMLGEDARERIEWASPFADSIARITALRGRAVAVLASGDPMWFGVGATLGRSVPLGEMHVIPAPSAFSLAAARLGWPIDDTACLTVHGRPVERILPFVQPGARLLILCRDGGTPATIAALLRDRGYGGSRLTSLSNLGGTEESTRDFLARDWACESLPDLTTLAVCCIAGPDARILSTAPGLPDDVFVHDGKITKREVRAATLAALAPLPGQLLWDVGAGSGAVGIEWMRAAKGARAIAIEAATGRCATIRDNALALGVPELEIVAGTAPEAMEDLPAPSAVFVGGGLTADGLLEKCHATLAPGGRLVANAVTLEGEQALAAFHRAAGGELVRIAVARAEPVGGFTGWRPMMPVTQLRLCKP